VDDSASPTRTEAPAARHHLLTARQEFRYERFQVFALARLSTDGVITPSTKRSYLLVTRDKDDGYVLIVQPLCKYVARRAADVHVKHTHIRPVFFRGVEGIHHRH
jgi:hypothetical protein